MKNPIVRSVTLIGAASVLSSFSLGAQATAALPVLAAAKSPGVDVWLETDIFEASAKATAFFNAVPGSYVTVVRVKNENSLEVLYPASPGDQAPYVRNAAARTTLAFRTDRGSGLGVIYAISSDKPFDYSAVSDGRIWGAERLRHPRGKSVEEVAGYFFNEITASTPRRFAMAQAAYINGAVVYKVGDPGFPTVIDAAGLGCNSGGTGRLCGDTLARRPINDPEENRVIHGTPATPPPPQRKP